MKKTIIYLSLFVVVAMSTSCKGFLDREPSDAVSSEQAIASYDDAVTALNGMYDGLQGNNGNVTYYGARMLYYGDVRGDQMQATTTSSRASGCYEFNYMADTAPIIWGKPYDVIRRANNLITALNEGKAVGATEAQKNELMGQALTMRALAHFDLAKIYCQPYTMSGAPQGFGIPVVTEAPKPSYKPGRGTLEEVYTQVISDLVSASTLMSEAKNTGYFNKWGAKSLLSRVYLFKGDNVNALAVAEDVITNSPYKLWTNAEYAGAWKKAGTSEVIFEIINFDSNDWTDREGIAYLINEDGYGDMILTPQIVKYFEANPKDVRVTATVESKKADNIKIYGPAKVWCAKYPGREGATDFRVNNIPLIRLSEVYLNAAEAAVKLNDPKADTYLNAIVQRANPEATPVVATLANVIAERGIELVGEGQRFFDLMRNDMSADRTVRYNNYPLISDAVTISNTFFRTILPIPKVERDANDVIAKQQNPGYGLNN